MTTMMPVDLECPNCGAHFEVQALMSTNFYGMTTDLRRLTSGYDPWEFMVHSCQKCGFTGGDREFEGKVDAGISEKIKESIFPHVRDERLSADTRWEFAAMIAEWREQDASAIADLYHNAAWCAASTERETYFRRRAADWLERSLETGVPNRPIILYLIGEMYRRCGEKSVAETWFDAAIGEATGPEDGRLKELA